MVSPPFHLSSVVSDPSLLFNLMAHTHVHTHTHTHGAKHRVRQRVRQRGSNLGLNPHFWFLDNFGQFGGRPASKSSLFAGRNKPTG